MGDRVPHAYRVALELERFGGYGVDHDATFEWKPTPFIAEETLQRVDLDEDMLKDVEQIRLYLERRWLPAGEAYDLPCMDSGFCDDLNCSCPEK